MTQAIPEIEIPDRIIGLAYPLALTEIGINHVGSFEKTGKMVWDARKVVSECVKFKCMRLTTK